jgi:hypothetical protein
MVPGGLSEIRKSHHSKIGCNPPASALGNGGFLMGKEKTEV